MAYIDYLIDGFLVVSGFAAGLSLFFFIAVLIDSYRKLPYVLLCAFLASYAIFAFSTILWRADNGLA